MSDTAIFVDGPRPGEVGIADSQAAPGTELFIAEGATQRVRHYYRTDGSQDELGRVVFRYLEPRELTPLKLPLDAWFLYRGARVVLRRMTNDDSYGLECPLCGARSFLTHAPGEHHTLSVRDDGALTASPSLRCPNANCSWHVVIAEGVAQ